MRVYITAGFCVIATLLLQELGLTGWTSNTTDALARTPRGATPLHRDHWTIVSDSTSADGLGLFAVKSLPAAFVLYTYTGVQRTSAEALRRPNAYQFELQSGKVCDASIDTAASPARYVNTRGSCAEDNNCVFKEHQGVVYLITTQETHPFEELFAPYGIADELYPSWPLAFPGDPHAQVEEYKLYLNKPLAGESSLLHRSTSSPSRHDSINTPLQKRNLQSRNIAFLSACHMPFCCVCVVHHHLRVNILAEYPASTIISPETVGQLQVQLQLRRKKPNSW